MDHLLALITSGIRNGRARISRQLAMLPEQMNERIRLRRKIHLHKKANLLKHQQRAVITATSRQHAIKAVVWRDRVVRGRQAG